MECIDCNYGGTLPCLYCKHRKESGLMNYIPFCISCWRKFKDGEVVCHNKYKSGFYVCYQCSERKTMPNIKITAEVDGKIVPLNTISTESFEAIKALEKSKGISVPVARIANHYNDPPRLLISPKTAIDLRVGRVYSIDLKSGVLVAEWNLARDEHALTTTYTNTKPL